MVQITDGAATVDFIHPRERPFRQVFATDPDEMLDLTGYAWRAELRAVKIAGPTPPPVIATFTVNFLGYSGGVSMFEVLLPDAVVEALPAAPCPGGNAEFHWSLVATPPGSLERDWMRGKFTVIGEPTE